MTRTFENCWNPGFSKQIRESLSGGTWVGCGKDQDELSFFHDSTGDALTFRGNRKEVFVWKMIRPGRVAILHTHHVPHAPYQAAEPALVHWYDLKWKEFDYQVTERLDRSIFLEIELFAGKFQLDKYAE